MLAEPAEAQRARTPNAADPSLAWIAVVADLAVARMAADGGATRADIVRDLAPLTSHRLSPSEQRSVIDAALVRIVISRLADETRGRFRLTESGAVRVAALFGKRTLPRDWPAIRDTRLLALALGLSGDVSKQLKALERPDSLRAAVLAAVYQIKVGRSGRISPSRLRTALAGVALGRAFGDRITSEIGSEGGLSARAGRLLAGQLLARPRDLGTDSRLLAALAAEAVAAPQPDINVLRTAVLRRYVTGRVDPAERGAVETGGGLPAPHQSQPARPRRAPAAAPVADAAVQASSGIEVDPEDALDRNQPRQDTLGERRAIQAGQVTQSIASGQPLHAERPDLAGFALAVRRAAEVHAEGWPGNRKAFVCDVWEQIRSTYPGWALTNVEFKAMLTEAHRTGHLALANADLGNKAKARELQASAIAYKNTVWHYVRVEDPN